MWKLSVSQLLSNLDPQKAGGPDYIPTKFLKEFSTQLAPCLTIIFQASLEQGIVPIDWRKAFVVPIYKKGQLLLSSKLLTYLSYQCCLQNSRTYYIL